VISVAPTPLVHLELHTRDQARARRFYSQLCAWESEWIDAGNGSYLALELGAVSGGLVECGLPHSMWLPYVEVAEIAEMTDRARQLGATVMLEPREGPAGWRSVVTSPDCGEIAFWEPKGSVAHE
jgi:predicted enzyme related to lactoylglutathione lyase